MSETFAQPRQLGRKISEHEAYEIGLDAYLYLYPLVLMHTKRLISTNYACGSNPGCGPGGAFHHVREYLATDPTSSSRPNFDTLNSYAWLDLSRGPYIVSVPDTHGRYYVLPLYDMWTDVFATLGSRTLGTGPGQYAIVPRRWNGTAPGAIECIESPTTDIWMNVRIQTDGPKDYPAAHRFQDGFSVCLLSQWGRHEQQPSSKIDPAVNVQIDPAAQVEAMTPAVFFKTAAEAMMIDVPHLTDWSMIARLRRIGIEPGKPFHLKKAPSAVQSALVRAPEDAWRIIGGGRASGISINGWRMHSETLGVYGNDYVQRATVAAEDFGAIAPEHEVWLENIGTSDGSLPTGHNDYVLRFENARLPPARAFWSITAYNIDGSPVRNPMNRFTIRSTDPLELDDGGALEIYLQHERPSAKLANWLPIPTGGMKIAIRIHEPGAELFDGRWGPPTLTRVAHGPSR